MRSPARPATCCAPGGSSTSPARKPSARSIRKKRSAWCKLTWTTSLCTAAVSRRRRRLSKRRAAGAKPKARSSRNRKRRRRRHGIRSGFRRPTRANRPRRPAGRQPKPAPPPPEPSIVDEFLDNPIALAGLGGVIVLLAGYGVWTWRKKKTTQARFQDSVLGAASTTGSSTGTGAALAAQSVSQGSLSQPLAGMEADEVDPIAEADVYMAYGRDAQAEEILKEALQKDAKRTAVHSKLLEIYANRRDVTAFEQTAVKLKSLTNGSGPEWDKAAALGRSIDPQNGLYGGGAAPAAAPAAAAAAAPPNPHFHLSAPTTPQAANPPQVSVRRTQAPPPHGLGIQLQ